MPLHNEEYAIEQNSRHTHLSLRHCILLFLFHNRRNTCLEFLFLSFLSIIFHELKSFHLFFHNMQIYLSRGRCKATNSFSKHQAALLYFLLYKMHYLKKKRRTPVCTSFFFYHGSTLLQMHSQAYKLG